MSNSSIDENDFTPVPLCRFQAGTPLCADVYLKIDKRYLKFKEKDDFIPENKYEFFVSKSVKFIYVETHNYQAVMNWLSVKKQEIVDEIVEEVGEENREVVEKQEEIKEIIYETFSDQELTSDNILMIQGTVSNFIDEIKDNETAKTALAQMLKLNSLIADHSLSVANLSVYLAMVCGHGHQLVLENVYMGAIFHDYGKAKIPASVLENKGNTKYNQAIQDHPVKGAEAIAKLNKISEQSLSIVREHHEQHNGQGYPNGLKDDEIYDLSKIVSVADVFINIARENNVKGDAKFKIAIKNIEYDRGKRFDPVIIPRIVDALKAAYPSK